MADILQMIEIRADPIRVYEAINEPAKWWAETIEGENVVGSILKLRFGDNGPDMKVIEQVPGKQVKWRCVGHSHREDFYWIGTDFTFDLSQSNAPWTEVRFDNTGWRETNDFFRFCTGKWGTTLISLKQYVETGEGTPFPKDIKHGSGAI